MGFDLFAAAAADRAAAEAAEAAARARPAGTATPPGPGPDHADGALTVSAVNALARELLEGGLPPLWVAGEVTGWKKYSSGHCYFSLRDATAQLRCVLFRADAQRLPAEPEEGMQVRVFGALTIYERRGEYQLVARRLEAAGQDGLWRLAFERLRRKLEAEGLLALERKRPVPRFPERVGVVTSADGAALQDILRVVERRAPWTRIVFCPARVQGDGSAAEIAAAIRCLGDARAADVLIVGRGGGSVEDLWAFNEEVVARAIAACPVPVISAVGHETDVSIADLVADLRAPTPSAAAERAVPDGAALGRALDEWHRRMVHALRRRVLDPQRRADWLGEALIDRARRAVRSRQERLRHGAGKLEALSPLAALRRGYAVPQAHDGRILRRLGDFAAGDAFSLRVLDGRVDCRVEGGRAEEAEAGTDGEERGGNDG